MDDSKIFLKNIQRARDRYRTSCGFEFYDSGSFIRRLRRHPEEISDWSQRFLFLLNSPEVDICSGSEELFNGSYMINCLGDHACFDIQASGATYARLDLGKIILDFKDLGEGLFKCPDFTETNPFIFVEGSEEMWVDTDATKVSYKMYQISPEVHRYMISGTPLLCLYIPSKRSWLVRSHFSPFQELIPEDKVMKI